MAGSFLGNFQKNPYAMLGLASGLLSNRRDNRAAFGAGLQGAMLGAQTDYRMRIAEQQQQMAQAERQRQIDQQAALMQAAQNLPGLAPGMASIAGSHPGVAMEAIKSQFKGGTTKPYTTFSFDPQGNPRFASGYSPTGAPPADLYSQPGKKALDTSQAEVGQGQKMMRQLARIGENYSKDFLTATGRMQGFAESTLDYLGMTGPEQQKRITQRTNFIQNVEQLFQQYRKEITGAAASVQELERLKQAMINTDMSPTEFEAAYKNFLSAMQADLEAHYEILQRGIPIGSREYQAEMQALAAEKLQQTTAPVDDPLGIR